MNKLKLKKNLKSVYTWQRPETIPPTIGGDCYCYFVVR